LYLVLGIFSLQWLAPYFSYMWTVEQGYERWEAILIAFTVLVGIYPLMMLLAIAIKWLVIGRYRAGEYPLWGLYYFRFWLVHTIQSSVPVAYLSGTPWLNWYYRLLGAKVGKDVHLSTPGFTCSDLVSVGDRTCVGAEASLTGYHVENGRLIIGSIQLGCDCFVGARAVVRENTTLEDGAALEDLSLLSAGKTIPTGQRWQGSPARPVKKPPVETTSLPTASTAKKFLLGFIHALGISLFPACVFSAILPGVVLLNYLGEIMGGYWFMVFAPLIGLSYVVFLCLEIVVFKWLLLGRVRAGNYALNSFFYVRKWFVDQLLMLSLDVIGSIYASIFLAPWYRMLGAKLGRRAEISTASFISPDLLSVGDESFIADSVSLGSGRVENGQVRLDVNHVGNRAFVGNSAVMPPGTVLGNNALLGCLSIPPANPESAREEGATWLGSPSMRLQQRQPSTTFALETTFKPTAKLQAQRATIEFIRAILPVTGFIILTCLLFRVTTYYELRMELWQVLTLFPLWYGGCGLLAVAFMVTLKWVLAGRYQPGEQPLWSFFVWRNELLNAAHEHLACDYIVNMLPGTPFICWYFRLLGAQIGKRVYLDSTDITEFDLVTLGNEAEINADATLQTHLFEDRVMKMSRVEIGDHCTVGSVALVLYDAKMESGSQLNDLSLLMKGETLPVGTCWEGIPAREAVMGCNTKG
jgi:non-ribosomal peptide synthetase-like protein